MRLICVLSSMIFLNGLSCPVSPSRCLPDHIDWQNGQHAGPEVPTWVMVMSDVVYTAFHLNVWLMPLLQLYWTLMTDDVFAAETDQGSF